MKVIAVYLFVISLVIIGCNSAERMNEDFGRFVERLEQSYTNEPGGIDWNKCDRRYNDYKVFYENSKSTMSTDERKKANHYIGRYNALVMKKAAQDLVEEFEDMSGQVEGLLKGLFEEAGE